MAIFLEAQDVFRLIQRELPEGVYPDGAPSGYYSTASVYSKASLIERAYDNMEVIYVNFFPQTAEEKQVDWEYKVFGFQLDGADSLAIRRQKVIDKLRTKPGLTIGDILNVVRSVIGDDKDLEIGEWGCEDGCWILDESELEITTIFAGSRSMDVTPGVFPGDSLCTVDPSVFGKTEEEWAEVREDAFTYSLLVYSYTLTADELALVDLLLTQSEPARSAHVIYDGLDPADRITPVGA